MPGARRHRRLTASASQRCGGWRGYPSTMASAPSPRVQPSRLHAAAGAFVTNWRNPELRRAQAAFFGAWTAEWAVTVVLAVYAYGRGGAKEVGVVALVRVLPAAIVAPLATQYADRWPREKVLVAVSVVRSVSIALAAWAVFVDGPALSVYALVTRVVSRRGALPPGPLRTPALVVRHPAGAGGRQRRAGSARLRRDAGRSRHQRRPARHGRAGPGARRRGPRLGLGRFPHGPGAPGADPARRRGGHRGCRWPGPSAVSAP